MKTFDQFANKEALDESAAYKRPLDSSVEKILENIAKRHLSVKTLQTRNKDSLDWYDVPIWGIEYALRDAYLAGAESAKNKK